MLISIFLNAAPVKQSCQPSGRRCPSNRSYSPSAVEAAPWSVSTRGKSIEVEHLENGSLFQRPSPSVLAFVNCTLSHTHRTTHRFSIHGFGFWIAHTILLDHTTSTSLQSPRWCGNELMAPPAPVDPTHRCVDAKEPGETALSTLQGLATGWLRLRPVNGFQMKREKQRGCCSIAHSSGRFSERCFSRRKQSCLTGFCWCRQGFLHAHFFDGICGALKTLFTKVVVFYGFLRYLYVFMLFCDTCVSFILPLTCGWYDFMLRGRCFMFMPMISPWLVGGGGGKAPGRARPHDCLGKTLCVRKPCEECSWYLPTWLGGYRKGLRSNIEIAHPLGGETR